ncbi:MAG: hypothetical protein ACPH9F_06720 [Candidatus Poseidoniaceae archaeon]
MGMVAMTYKVNPDAEMEDVDTDMISTTISTFGDDTYDVQSVEVKPLAFGLKFVQVHVVMNDGEGLADMFEEKMSSISGVGEIEVISMGLL